MKVSAPEAVSAVRTADGIVPWLTPAALVQVAVAVPLLTVSTAPVSTSLAGRAPVRSMTCAAALTSSATVTPVIAPSTGASLVPVIVTVTVRVAVAPLVSVSVIA